MSAQAEAAAARKAAALFRRPECGLLEVSGADRVRWLDGMLSNDVTQLAPGAAQSGCPALLLTRQGRIVADPHVLAIGESFWLDVERAALAKTRETLERFIVADQVELRDASADWERLALEGPAAGDALAALMGAPLALAASAGVACEIAGAHAVVAAYGATAGARQLWIVAGEGERVARALLEAAGDHGLFAASPAALEILRIEAGRPRVLMELDESVLPAEAALESAVSFTKGCYTGQEIVARLASQGTPAHRLVGLAFEGPELAEVGVALEHAAKRVGEVTSACISADHGAIALGFVRAKSAVPGTELSAGARTARVTALPFAA